MRITVETIVNAARDAVWSAWNDPADIERWNTPSEDWHTTKSSVDLREGGRFASRMEAKDGSAGFDFAGTYTLVEPGERIEFRMDDGREVEIEFDEHPGGIVVRETFDAETENSVEMQRAGWQSILDSFARHVEAKG